MFGAAGRIRTFQRVIEMLVESASLYSAVIVVLLVFEVRDEVAGAYIKEFAIAIRVRTTSFVSFSLSRLQRLFYN